MPPLTFNGAGARSLGAGWGGPAVVLRCYRRHRTTVCDACQACPFRRGYRRVGRVGWFGVGITSDRWVLGHRGCGPERPRVQFSSVRARCSARARPSQKEKKQSLSHAAARRTFTSPGPWPLIVFCEPSCCNWAIFCSLCSLALAASHDASVCLYSIRRAHCLLRPRSRCAYARRHLPC